jgi:hypothetical protein
VPYDSIHRSSRGFLSHCAILAHLSPRDKGEVGGSSPPTPTIKITSKYEAILTFPLSGNISQKTNLPTIWQLYDWPDGTTLRALKPFGSSTSEKFICFFLNVVDICSCQNGPRESPARAEETAPCDPCL